MEVLKFMILISLILIWLILVKCCFFFMKKLVILNIKKLLIYLECSLLFIYVLSKVVFGIRNVI